MLRGETEGSGERCKNKVKRDCNSDYFKGVCSFGSVPNLAIEHLM